MKVNQYLTLQSHYRSRSFEAANHPAASGNRNAIINIQRKTNKEANTQQQQKKKNSVGHYLTHKLKLSYEAKRLVGFAQNFMVNNGAFFDGEIYKLQPDQANYIYLNT